MVIRGGVRCTPRICVEPKNSTSHLLPEFQTLASLLDAQPPEVQEAFQFLLATAMHEVGKFGLLIHIAFNLDIPSRLM